jgi:hypothetical protein
MAAPDSQATTGKTAMAMSSFELGASVMTDPLDL